jgi:hypothetical protein
MKHVCDTLQYIDDKMTAPISASLLMKYRSAKDVLCEALSASIRADHDEDVRYDHESYLMAYKAHIWNVIRTRPFHDGVIHLHFYDILPQHYKPRVRTKIPPRAFLRASFLSGDKELFKRLSLPPILQELIAFFAPFEFELCDISNPKLSSRWVLRLAIDEQVPLDFVCPITHERMQSATVASDGHTYEKVAIEEVLRRTKLSPLTREPLRDDLVPNHSLRKRMREYDEERSAHRPCVRPP